MGINAAGLELVKGFEGLYLKAYKCPAGVWTIGWGHTGKVDGVKIGSGMTITKAKAEELLKADLAYFWGYVNRKDYVPLTDTMNANQKAALCSLAFNCGENCLKTLCKNRSLSEIADAILLYNKTNGKVSQGLVDRRKAERNLFLMNDKVVAAATTVTTEKRICNMATLRRGDEGTQVGILQTIVGADVDCVFGPKTEERVKKVQKSAGLKEDGIAGPKFWAAYLK